MPLLSDIQLEAIKAGFKILLFCLVAGGPATVVWFERNDHWAGVIEKSDADAEHKKNEAIATLNQTILDLGAQHEKDLADIADLRRHPVRVQLPSQACAGELPQAGGSQLPTSGAGQPDNPAQSAFDDFTAGMEDDAAEWSRAIAACRVMQDYIKKMP